MELDTEFSSYGGDSVGPSLVRFRGWSVACTKGPMAGAAELDELAARVAEAVPAPGQPPLPEIIFGQNRLTLTHEASGVRLSFGALGGLEVWARRSAQHGAAGLTVPMASSQAWKEKAAQYKQQDPARNFDWTYTADYSGDVVAVAPEPASEPAGMGRGAGVGGGVQAAAGGEVEAVAGGSVGGGAAGGASIGGPSCAVGASPTPPSWSPHTGPGIDYALLKRTDLPILCFADLILFSDDLHDCGESELRLRLRLMPGCFFILLRHFLRVDGVFIRTHDTRIFHKFGAKTVLRATRVAQAPLPALPAAPAAAAPVTSHGAPFSPALTPLPDEAAAAQLLAAVPAVHEAVEEIRL